MMLSRTMLSIVIVLMVCGAELCASFPTDKERLFTELERADNDGALETAVINDLFAKQIVNRLRNQMDFGLDLQRKRNYWKQCAFNAVSCFGK